MYDAIIVGAGPAGLSAALLLGRCRRRVLVHDSGQYRNAASRELHGFLSRDGIDPAELRRLAREDLRKYETVELVEDEVRSARQADRGFEVTLASGRVQRARRLVFATGVLDELPRIEGLRELYGVSVFHCPYCDGWEQRDQPIAVLGIGGRGPGLAMELTAWTRDIILCTDGPADFPDEVRERLLRNRITMREERILRLEPKDGRLARVVFAAGSPAPRHALFFTSVQRQRSPLAEHLGCKFTANGMVSVNEYEATEVPGLFVAGDASGAQFHIAVVGAAEGARAAMAVNTSLLKEDLA